VTVGILAILAEEERRAILEWITAVLVAAKACGVKRGGWAENLKNAELGAQKRPRLGGSRTADLMPVIELSGLRASPAPRRSRRR